MGLVRSRTPRPRRVVLPAALVAGLAVIAFGIAACDLDSNGEPQSRADAPVPHVSVGDVELYPIPDAVAAACREASADARAPILCPTHLPRPSVAWTYTALAPRQEFKVEPLDVRGRAYGVDISYDGPTEQPRNDRPERFLHFDVQVRHKGWNVSDRLPPGVSPARLGDRQGLLAPATSRDYAVEPFWGNHVRFFWREGGTRYAATLHNFGPGTRALLDALVTRLRPVEELRPEPPPISTGVERMPLPIANPASVAVSDTAVWVAGKRNLIGLDPASGEVVADDARYQDGPAYLAADNTIWVAHPASFYYTGDDRLHYRDDALERLDPKRGRFAQSILGNRGLSGVALGEGSVWVSDLGRWPGARDYEGGSVQRVDPKAGRVVAEAAVGRAPAAVTVGEGGVWVTNNLDDTVSRIDPQTMKATSAISVGDSPTGVAAGLGGVWVANSGSNTITWIDPHGDEPARTVAVGDGPRGVALGEGSVWVANYLDDTVSRIDPAAMEVTETIRVGSGPVGIAVGHGAVWVATAHDRALFRIDP